MHGGRRLGGGGAGPVLGAGAGGEAGRAGWGAQEAAGSSSNQRVYLLFLLSEGNREAATQNRRRDDPERRAPGPSRVTWVPGNGLTVELASGPRRQGFLRADPGQSPLLRRAPPAQAWVPGAGPSAAV